jgi:hypothetical protein
MRRAWLWAAIAAVVVFGWLQGGTQKEIMKLIAGSINEEQHGPQADEISARLGLDPKILRAIISQESGWSPKARNLITKDYGLGGINITTATTYNQRYGWGHTLPTDLYDVDINFAYIEATLTEIVRQAHLTAPADIFNAWNVGWPKAKRGVQSPYLAKYQAHYDIYAERAAANG